MSTKRQRPDFHKVECEKLTSTIWRWDELGMFHNPVNVDEVPGYNEVIENPIDLTLIRARLKRGDYVSDEQFVSDIILLISNALLFNEKRSEWYRHAEKLRKRLPAMLETTGLDPELGEDVYKPSIQHDKTSSLLKDEAKLKEDLKDTVQKCIQDAEIPIEELRAKYSRSALCSEPACEEGCDSSSFSSGSLSNEESSSDESDSEDLNSDES